MVARNSKRGCWARVALLPQKLHGRAIREAKSWNQINPAANGFSHSCHSWLRDDVQSSSSSSTSFFRPSTKYTYFSYSQRNPFLFFLAALQCHLFPFDKTLTHKVSSSSSSLAHSFRLWMAKGMREEPGKQKCYVIIIMEHTWASFQPQPPQYLCQVFEHLPWDMIKMVE